MDAHAPPARSREPVLVQSVAWPRVVRQGEVDAMSRDPVASAAGKPLTLTPMKGELSEPRKLEVDEPITVGRSQKCTVRLRHESVSKQHARLEHVDGGWHVTDLGSLNGTFHNGTKLVAEKPAALQEGDTIEIGSSSFRIDLGNGPPPSQTNDPYRTRATIFIRLRADDSQTRELGWEEFRNRYAPVIVGFARNAGLPSQDADDVLQVVMLNFFRISGQFEYDPSKGRFRGYLKRATLNVIRKRLRKKSPSFSGEPEQLGEDHPFTDELWEKAWADQVMQRAIEEVRGRFDGKTFEAFELYAQRSVPAKAVSEELDISINSVHQAKSRVVDAISQVVTRIREEEG
jgi:RNA polymerase sigma-70 factor (ECF subfamily)